MVRTERRVMFQELGHMVITDRDIEIFQYLNEQKYLMANQIYETFWPKSDISSGTARQRLTKLVNVGYIKTLDIQKDKKEKLRLFLLTEKGIHVLKPKGLDHGFSEITKDINRYTMDHTLKLATIRSVFRSLGENKWRSERVLRKQDYERGFFPDAVLEINGLKVALELENSFREKERYIIRFTKYAKSQEFTLIIYIISWPMVKGWLMDIEAPQDKLAFLLYEDLMNKRGNAELVNKTSRVPLKAILG